MTLDDHARQLMEMLDAVYPDVESLPPEASRAQLRQLVESGVLAANAEDVAQVEDRRIPGPGGDLPVRLYRPDGPEPLPVLVYFHGGGWVVCDLETHDPTCRALANGAGSLVVSVDYRLAPEQRYPAAAEDAHAATAWTAEHAHELGADPARLAVAGDSAGGNLAAVTCLMARDRGGPPVCFQLLVYPVTDCAFGTASYRDNATDYFLTRSEMEWYWRQYLGADGDAASPYASPLRAESLADLPPALVITAEHDPLRDEGEAYARRLEDAGVDAIATRYDGVFHGFFSLKGALPAADAAHAEAYAALRAALGGG